MAITVAVRYMVDDLTLSLRGEQLPHVAFILFKVFLLL